MQAPAPCITHRAIKPISARTRAELAISPFDGLARCWRHDQRALDIFEGDRPAFVASSARRARRKVLSRSQWNAHQHAISKRCASCSIGRPRLFSDFFMGGLGEPKSATTGNRYIARWFVNYRSSDQALPRGGRDRTCWDLLFP